MLRGPCSAGEVAVTVTPGTARFLLVPDDAANRARLHPLSEKVCGAATHQPRGRDDEDRASHELAFPRETRRI